MAQSWARISPCAFYIIFPSFLICQSKSFMRILLILSKHTLSQDINFHRMAIYLKVLPIDPGASLHMFSRSPLLGRKMYQLVEISCSLFNVYLVCVCLPPSIQMILLLVPDIMSEKLK
jgi:hypothetical protein